MFSYAASYLESLLGLRKRGVKSEGEKNEKTVVCLLCVGTWVVFGLDRLGAGDWQLFRNGDGQIGGSGFRSERNGHFSSYRRGALDEDGRSGTLSDSASAGRLVHGARGTPG